MLEKQVYFFFLLVLVYLTQKYWNIGEEKRKRKE